MSSTDGRLVLHAYSPRVLADGHCIGLGPHILIGHPVWFDFDSAKGEGCWPHPVYRLLHLAAAACCTLWIYTGYKCRSSHRCLRHVVKERSCVCSGWGYQPTSTIPCLVTSVNHLCVVLGRFIPGINGRGWVGFLKRYACVYCTGECGWILISCVCEVRARAIA